MEDYYKILEINPSASVEVMTQAYRTLVKKYHPDRYYTTSHKNQMGHRLQRINEAYAILSDPTRRERYDTDYAAYLTNKPQLEHRQAQTVQRKKGLYWFLMVIFLSLVFRTLGAILAAFPPILKLLLLAGTTYLAYRFLKRRRPKA